jgi:hypothetical protein
VKNKRTYRAFTSVPLAQFTKGSYHRDASEQKKQNARIL